MKATTDIKERISNYREERDAVLASMSSELRKARFALTELEGELIDHQRWFAKSDIYNESLGEVRLKLSTDISANHATAFHAINRLEFYVNHPHGKQEFLSHKTQWHLIIRKYVKPEHHPEFRRVKKTTKRAFAKYEKCAVAINEIWLAISAIVEIPDTVILPSIDRSEISHLSGLALTKAKKRSGLLARLNWMFSHLAYEHQKFDQELDIQLADFNSKYTWPNKSIAFHWDLSRYPSPNALRNIKGVRGFYISKPIVRGGRAFYKTPIATVERDKQRKVNLIDLNREFIREKQLHRLSSRILGDAKRIKALANRLDITIQNTLGTAKQFKTLNKVLST